LHPEEVLLSLDTRIVLVDPRAAVIVRVQAMICPTSPMPVDPPVM